MPIQESNQKEGASTPLGIPGGPQVELKVWVVQNTKYHYKHEHILISISFSRPDVSCSFYSLLCNYHSTGLSMSKSGVLGVQVYWNTRVYQDIRYYIPVM